MTVFHDVAQGPGPTTVDKANRVSLGTITLSQTGNFLSRVWAQAVNVGTKTEANPLCGYITLESNDALLEPYEFPFEPTGSHLGATPHTSRQPARKFLINRPITAGGLVDVFCTLGIAAPQGAPEILVTLEYTDGEQIFPGAPHHMQVLEPSAALSTGDGDQTTLPKIELRDAFTLVLVWAVAEVETPVADESIIVQCKITCNEFAVAGPLNFGLEPKEETDATTGWGGLMITYLETVRPFKGDRADIVATMTQRDANNAAPEAFVGVAYI